MSIAGALWLEGFGTLLFYALVGFLRIRKTVEESVLLGENIRLYDHISSPFILGILRPVIYLPSGITQIELHYVLAHEKAHLRRRDHWWKPLGYLLLSRYWFHPLIRAAYVFFCWDMELTCDEKVIKDMDLEEKKACLLAFGESNVKDRQGNQGTSLQKTAFWIIIDTETVCATATVCFLANPVKKPDQTGTAMEISPDQSRTDAGQPGHDDAMIRYPDRWYSREELSEDTIRWLEMYNSLPPEVQLAIDSVPWDLYAFSHTEGGTALETAPKAEEPAAEQNTRGKEPNPKGRSMALICEELL